MSSAVAAPEGEALRAAALLDTAPGLYSLRKRRRNSSQAATSPTTREDPQRREAGHDRPAETTSAERPTSAGPPVATFTRVIVTPQADAPQVVDADAAPARRGPPATGSPAAVHQTLLIAAQDQSEPGDARDEDEDDDGGDDSSLTSLSDLEERFHLATPGPSHRERPRTLVRGAKLPPKTAISPASSASAMTTPSAGSEYRPDGFERSDDQDDHDNHRARRIKDSVSPLPMEVETQQFRSTGSESRKKAPPVKRRAGNPRRSSISKQGLPATRQALQAASGPSHAQSAPLPSQPPAAPVSARKRLDQRVAGAAPLPPPAPAPKRKKALVAASLAQGQPAKASGPARPAGAVQERSGSLFSGIPRLTSDFRPAAMPTVMNLYERRQQVLQEARLEATRDVDLQRKSEEQIETAIRALDGGDQQTGLCLAMNRYSAFCALGSVDVPPFPITATKVALFLARAPATALSTLLLSVFPQPTTYPLPIAGIADPNLTPEEGSRVSRELVQFWVEALAYAQRATINIWAPILRSVNLLNAHGQQHLLSEDRIHPSLDAIEDDVALREIYGAIETSESIMRSEEQARRARDDLRATFESGTSPVVPVSQPSRQGKTKWTKGGKPVAPPPPSRSSSSGRTTSSELVLAPSAASSVERRREAAAPETVVPARDSTTRPVEYWQVTNAQVPPVLPIASAPVSIPIPTQHVPVASASQEPFDAAHRRRNTTSNLALVSPWMTQPEPPLGQQQQHQPRPTDFPRPISIHDPNALQAVLSEQNLSPWAREFLQQASHVSAEPNRRHSRASTFTFEMHGAPWVSPYDPIHGVDATGYAASLSAPQALQQQAVASYPDTYVEAGPIVDDTAYGAANDDSPGPGTSPFGPLAAVANDCLSADLGASPPLHDDRLGASSMDGVTALFPHGSDQYAQAGPGGLQTPWTSSGSGSRHGSPADPFTPSLHDPALSGLVQTRYQPHAPMFEDATSRFGRIVDSALASISHFDAVSAVGGTHAGGGGGRGIMPSQPQIPPMRPSAYPTPDSPSIEHWPVQPPEGGPAVAAWSSAAPLTGLDAVLLQPGFDAAAELEPSGAEGAASPSHYAAYGLGLSYV